MEKHPLAGLYPQRLAEAKDAAVDGRHIVDRVHGTVGAREQIAIPIMQGEEDLLVIARRIVARFNEKKSVLTGVLPLVQVFAGKDMGVIPTEA